MNLENIYWIGGSPCSGKSTISELLVDKHDFDFYKCDDYIFKHLQEGVKRGYPIISKLDKMTNDEIWMRDIDFQVKEEFLYYLEELTMILEDIQSDKGSRKLLVEGTAIIPEFVEKMKIANDRVVFIIPSKEFQLQHYQERDFIPYVLEGCKDQNKAYDNWMQRDIKFALEVKKQALANNRHLIVNDGTKSITETCKLVEKYFNLNRP